MTKMKRYPRFLGLAGDALALLSAEQRAPLSSGSGGQCRHDAARFGGFHRACPRRRGRQPDGGRRKQRGQSRGRRERIGALGGNALVMQRDAVVGWTGTEGWAGYTIISRRERRWLGPMRCCCMSRD